MANLFLRYNCFYGKPVSKIQLFLWQACFHGSIQFLHAIFANCERERKARWKTGFQGFGAEHSGRGAMTTSMPAASEKNPQGLPPEPRRGEGSSSLPVQWGVGQETHFLLLFPKIIFF